MADISLGDIRASLRIDTGDFARSIEEANRRLEALAQQLRQMQQAMQAGGQSSAQIAQALRELAQTTQQGTQAYTQAAQQALAYRQEQDRLRESTRQTREEQGRATDGWRQFLQIAGGVGIATGLTALVSQMTAFAKSVVDVGVSMQALRTTLGAIAGDAAAGGRQFQYLFDTSQRLGVSLTSLTDGYRSLSAATRGTILQGVETQKIFEGVTTAGRAFGATSQQIGQAMFALEQMISKGTVSMEELRRQLGNAIPGAFQQAATAIGRTQEELTNLVTSGEVRAIPFVRALARYWLEEFGPAAEKAGNTASGAFNRLGNQIVALKDAIAQSGLLNFLRDAADGATKLLKIFTDFQQAQAQLRAAQGEPIGGARRVDIEQLPLETRQRLATVQREINEQMVQMQLQGPTQGPGVLAARRDILKQLQEEEAAILAQTSAIRAQREEKEKKNAEDRKARDATEQDKADLDAIIKKFDELGKSQAALGRQGVRIPELGTAFGSPEELKKLQEQQKELLTTGLEDINKLIDARRRTAGPLPDIVEARLSSLREQLSGLQDAEERLATETRLRDVLKQQVEQIQAAITKHQAEKIAISDSAAAAEAFTRQETQRRQQANVGAEAAMGQLPMRQQINVLQAQLKTLTPQAEGLAGDVEAMKAAKVQADALDAANMKQLETLRTLYQQYGLTKVARDQDTASMAMEALANTNLSEEARKYYDALKPILDIEAKLPDLRRQAAASAPAGIEALRGVQTEDVALQHLRDRLEQLQAPKAGVFGETREGIRARQLADRAVTTEAGQKEAAQLRERIEHQQRLNYYIGLFEQLGTSVGSAWTNALQGIAQGTQTVAQAFKNMAQSILQSLAQIASQEAFRGLMRLAVGLISGGASSAVGGIGGGGASMGNVSTGSGFLRSVVGSGGGGIARLVGGGSGGWDEGMAGFAGGGVVNRPTFALLGENPATTPEVIMNRQQMAAFMRAAPSAGGQAAGGNVTIINVPNMAAAEEEQARQRALGHATIINVVASEMAQGDKSQLLKIVRLAGR